MNLKLGLALVGHSLNLCSIFVPALLVGRTNFGQKGLWVGWYPYSSTGSPAGLQEVATSDFMPPAASHSSSHPHRLPGASPIPGLWHILEMPPSCLLPISILFPLISLHVCDPQTPFPFPSPLPHSCLRPFTFNVYFIFPSE